VLKQPVRIDIIGRLVADIRIQVNARLLAERILGYKASDGTIVVPRAIVVQAGSISLSASESERVGSRATGDGLLRHKAS
jgi:hypothetical protein